MFNWTEQPRSHTFSFADLNLTSGHTYHLYDALNQDQPLTLDGETIHLNDQAPQSVKLIKIIDDSKPAAAPTVVAQVPAAIKVREDAVFSAKAAEGGVPALGYHWDFGDGVTADGAAQRHTYTRVGNYGVKLTVDGVDGIAAEKTFAVAVDGLMGIGPPRRYTETNP